MLPLFPFYLLNTCMKIHTTIFICFKPRVLLHQYSDSGNIATILMGIPWKRQNIGNTVYFLPSFLPQEKLWAWCFHPTVWHFAKGHDCVVRRRFRFFNQLRGGWFCILLEFRGLSTGVWISHMGNRSMYCWISVSVGARRMDDIPFHLSDVTSYMILIILNLLIFFLVSWYDLSWWMFYVHFKWALPWLRW